MLKNLNIRKSIVVYLWWPSGELFFVWSIILQNNKKHLFSPCFIALWLKTIDFHCVLYIVWSKTLIFIVFYSFLAQNHWFSLCFIAFLSKNGQKHWFSLCFIVFLVKHCQKHWFSYGFIVFLMKKLRNHYNYNKKWWFWVILLIFTVVFCIFGPRATSPPGSGQGWPSSRLGTFCVP